MKTIHKKLIPATHGYHTIILPVGSELLSVGATGSNGMVPIYVKVENLESSNSQVQIFIAMTNLRCADSGEFLGTCTLDSQAAHVFTLAKT